MNPRRKKRGEPDLFQLPQSAHRWPICLSTVSHCLL
jgi:hypothetical protein